MVEHRASYTMHAGRMMHDVCIMLSGDECRREIQHHDLTSNINISNYN